MVTSLEFGRGNLPYEFQYENKPPLLFLIFGVSFCLVGCPPDTNDCPDKSVDDIEESKMFWENQIDELKHTIGA